MPLTWLERFFPKRAREPTAMELYQQHIAEEKPPSLQTIQLLLNVFNAPEVSTNDNIQFRLSTEITSRFKTVDDLLYSLQQANAAMVVTSPIHYAAAMETAQVSMVDDYFTTNQGFPLYPAQVISLVETCVTLYAQQLTHYRTIGYPERSSYYERVYAFYFVELHQVLRPLLNLRHP